MSNELTLDDSQPVELYEFTGAGETTYLTSDILDWNIDGNDYISTTGLKRSLLKVGTHEAEKDEMVIEIPTIGEAGTPVQIAYDWAFADHPPDLEVTIKRIDRAVGTSYVIWKGRVSTIEVQGIVAKIKCPTRFVSILNRRVPTVGVQPQCNHVLFDERCGLSRATYTFTRTVTSLAAPPFIAFSGGSLPASDGGLGPSNDFLNGEVLNTRTGETRTITGTNFTGNSVKVNYPFYDILLGDEIEITQGCDHNQLSPYGCLRYNNLNNFSGFQLMPGEDRNMFEVGIY